GLSMRRVFGVLALVTATGGVVFNASTVTYPKLFQERLSDLLASPQTLGVVVSLAYAFGAVAQLIMGRLIDRLNLKLPFVFLTFCQVPLLLALAYGHGSAVVLFGALFMFAVFGQVTVNDAMVAHFVAPQWQARVFALRYFLSFGASAAAIPMIAYLEPRQGLLGLYLVLAGFAALTFAA
ncbi:MFS transporter, partial [Pseudomonas aeruginosa]|nr:MFS transporter [Pseudomonas aeruginosa]